MLAQANLPRRCAKLAKPANFVESGERVHTMMMAHEDEPKAPEHGEVDEHAHMHDGGGDRDEELVPPQWPALLHLLHLAEVGGQLQHARDEQCAVS